jgi:multiple sugar transport system substrate-binding protein
MVEIELSTIPDASIDTETMQALLQEFETLRGVKVKLSSMRWGTAWTDLLTIASRVQGPDVSHVGGTWVSSLAVMNTLRPFRLTEIQEMGGSKAFMQPTWQSSFMVGDDHVWAVPWTGYAYLICYRRDLLQKAGIADPGTAFADQAAILDTIQKLKKSRLDIAWLMELVPPPYTDLVHTAASWIWGAGGEIVNESGKEVNLNRADSIQGLSGWLEVHRAVPAAYSRLSPVENVKTFAAGKAAAVVTDNRSADTYIMGQGERVVRENLGVANLSQAPWCGGGSLVIWKHVRKDAQREQAAVDLVKFLTSKEAEIKWARKVNSLMARIEALEEIYPENHPMHAALLQAARDGRAYRTVPAWRRLEYQFAVTLNSCLQEARDNHALDAAAILHKHLDPLVERLNLTLKG